MIVHTKLCQNVAFAVLINNNVQLEEDDLYGGVRVPEADKNCNLSVYKLYSRFYKQRTLLGFHILQQK